RLGGLVPDRSGQIVVQDAGPAEVPLEAPDAFPLLLLLHPVEIDVRARIVGGCVRGGAVRNGLDEGRPSARARTRDCLARRLEAREHVRAVDAQPRDAVADGLVGERLGTSLRLDRRRDRPTVVVTVEDEWRAGDGGEYRAFV